MSVVQVHRDTDLYRAGRARNIGARHAPWPWLLFADASTVPGPDFLARFAPRPWAMIWYWFPTDLMR